MLSQYNVCYIIIEDRKEETDHLSLLTSVLVHSYIIEPFHLDSIQSYDGKKDTIYKIYSQNNPIDIEKTDGLIKNSDFKSFSMEKIDSDRAKDIPFLGNKSEITFPEFWILDLNNKRGFKFKDWSFQYSPDDQSSPGITFHSDACGIAMRSRTKLEIKDYSLLCHARTTPDASVYFFLYAYNAKGKLLAVQNIGFLTPDAGRIDKQIPINAKDLPQDSAFFHFGFIAMGKHLCIERVNAIEKTKES